MDRRTLPPAIVVLVLVAICVWILPAIADQVSVDDPIKAGDVIQLGSDVQFTPATGWQLDSGVRQGDAGPDKYPTTATLAQRGFVITVTADAYSGTPDQLLDQLRTDNDRNHVHGSVSNSTTSIVTLGGQPGVLTRFTNGSTEGILAAFVFGKTGVEVDVSGPASSDSATVDDILGMLRSVQPTASTTSGSAS